MASRESGPARSGTYDAVGRLPDFLLVGAMKSGTTSLFRWLGSHPDVHLPAEKEPGFFHDESQWGRGPSHYRRLFPRDGRVTGEASIYARPGTSPVAAARAAQLVPDARVMYLMRHPVQRLRSHYRHEVQRGRERRPFTDAVADPRSAYAERSCYGTLLAPWVQAFPPTQLLTLRFEDLVGTSDAAWCRVLEHLGLTPTARPDTVHNQTDAKQQFSSAFRWLWEAGLDRPLYRLPSPVRRAGRRLLMRDDGAYRELLEGSHHEPVPGEVTDTIWADVARLESLLGSGPLWPAGDDSG